MANVTNITNSFANGEYGEELGGRSDLQGYFSSAKLQQNWVSKVNGSMTRTPGTEFIVATKGNGVAVMIPFKFGVVQTYMCEYGAGYIRFFTSKQPLLSGPPVEVVTPYTVDDLAAIRWTQSNDVLYNFHPTYDVYKLSRITVTTFSFVKVTWIDGPYLDENPDDLSTITPSATTGAITLVSTDDLFAATDVGRLVRIGHLTTDWAQATPYVVGDVRNANSSVYICRQAGTSNATGTGPSGIGVAIKDGTVIWDFSNTGGVGWGYVEITGFTDSKNVAATVLRDLVSATASASWRLGFFSDTTGFPSCGAFHEDRLYLGGARLIRPNMLFGSVVGDFETHTPSVDDDGPIVKPVQSDEVNAIEWLQSSGGLMIGTEGVEAVLIADRDLGAIKPTSAVVKIGSNEGSEPVQPQSAQQSVFFVVRTAKRVGDLNFDSLDRTVGVRDVTIRNPQITDDGLVDGVTRLAFQKNPFSVLWGVRNDGMLIGLTFNKAEKVLAWHRHPVGGDGGQAGTGPDDKFGKVLSAAAIPGPVSDELWVVVERQIDGGTKRYVEVMSEPHRKSDDPALAVLFDSAVVQTGLAAATVITGLDHLDGETVAVKIDGGNQLDQVVVGGQITVGTGGDTAVIGLRKRSIWIGQDPEGGSKRGSSRGKQQINQNIYLGLHLSGGMQYGPELDRLTEIQYRNVDDAMDTAVPLFTGSLQLEFLSQWSPEANVVLFNDSGLPSTVTFVSGNLSVGDSK